MGEGGREMSGSLSLNGLPCTHKSSDTPSPPRSSPPKSPILGNFEIKRGFRGKAIYLVQSPPILGDLGVSRLKRIYEDLCVYGSSMGEGWGEGGFSEPTC